MNIPIFLQEKKDGLVDLINDTSFAYHSPINRLSVPIEEVKQIIDNKRLAKANQENLEDRDLYWFASILVSVGWNKNDDVFDATETWIARNTPVNKRFNLNHNETDIIGHMTAAMVLGPDGKIIQDGADDAFEIPDVFDIAVASVLYKDWADEDLSSRMSEMIDEIENSEWSVSMECIFRNFDYALISPEGDKKVVRRSKATAHLTKHLRIYGGSGEIEGYKIGRLLRSMSFCGNALVKNPANPRSIILNDTTEFTSAAYSEEFKSEKQMADTNTDIVQVSKELATANEEIKKLRSELEAQAAKAQKEAQAQLEKKLGEKDKVIADLNETIKQLEEEKTSATTQVEELEKKVETTEASLKDATEKIEKAKAEAAKAARISKLVEVGVESSEAESIVNKWSSSSDEQFEDVVVLYAEKMNKKDDKDKKNSKDKDDMEKDDKKKAEAADLSEAETESEPSLSVESDEVDETDDVIKAIASYFDEELNGTSDKK